MSYTCGRLTGLLWLRREHDQDVRLERPNDIRDLEGVRGTGTGVQNDDGRRLERRQHRHQAVRCYLPRRRAACVEQEPHQLHEACITACDQDVAGELLPRMLSVDGAGASPVGRLEGGPGYPVAHGKPSPLAFPRPELNHLARAAAGGRMKRTHARRDLLHRKVVIEEDHVDRELHERGVDRERRTQDATLVGRQSPPEEQSARAPHPCVCDLDLLADDPAVLAAESLDTMAASHGSAAESLLDGDQRREQEHHEHRREDQEHEREEHLHRRLLRLLLGPCLTLLAHVV